MEPDYMKAFYELIMETSDKVSVACAAALLIALSLAFYFLCKKKNRRDVGEVPSHVNGDGKIFEANKFFIVHFRMKCEPKKNLSWWCFCKDHSEGFETNEPQGYSREIINHDPDEGSLLDNENDNVNYLNQTCPNGGLRNASRDSLTTVV